MIKSKPNLFRDKLQTQVEQGPSDKYYFTFVSKMEMSRIND